MKTKWYQSKTSWTTLIAAAVNLAHVFFGVELPPGFNEVAVSLIVIFLRIGVEKSGG